MATLLHGAWHSKTSTIPQGYLWKPDRVSSDHHWQIPVQKFKESHMKHDYNHVNFFRKKSTSYQIHVVKHVKRSQIYKIVQKLGCSAKLDTNQEVDTSHCRIMLAEAIKQGGGAINGF